MQFNDTTNKHGLIQHCERLTNLGDATISGTTALLKAFTSEINLAFDEVLPVIHGNDRKWQWDDPNHTDYPIATIDLVSGQADYSFTSDEDGNSILEIDRVYLKNPVSGDYELLTPVDAQSGERDASIAGNTSNAGTPTAYDKLATAVFFDPPPNYSLAGGAKAVFRRSQSYFSSSDTTKTPGIPTPFHQLLSLIASRNWLKINKPESKTLVEVKQEIADKKSEFAIHMNRRSRDEKTVMRPRRNSSR